MVVATNRPLGTKVAAYLRISSDKQDAESQRQTITAWAARYGIEIQFWFEDSEGRNSRDLPHKRKAFQQLLEAVKARLIDTIIVDSQDRFGVKNAWQFGEFASLLAQHGCQLWSTTQGLLSGDDDATVLNSTLGAITSRREQKEKAHRGIRGKIAKAKLGEYQGGYPAYGLDVVCFDAYCKEKWRVVWEGHFKRIKVFPDGTSVRFDGKDNFPTKDKTDTLRYRPTKIKERLKYIRQIFEWYATEDISPRQIATRLTKLGVDPIFSEWEKVRVGQYLRNPVYIGFPAWNKSGQSRFSEFVDGEIREVATTTGKIVTGRHRDESDHIKPEKPEFAPIIPLELWAKVQAKIKSGRETLTPAQRKKHSRNDALWLSGFLVCGHCDKMMITCGAVGIPRLEPNYFCGTYNRYGSDNTTGCRCHRVNAELLHNLVAKYIGDLSQKIKDLQTSPISLLQLTIGANEAALVKNDEARMIGSEFFSRARELVGSLSDDELEAFLEAHPKLRDGQWGMAGIRQFCDFFDKTTTEVGKQVAAVQRRIDNEVDLMASLPKSARKRSQERLEGFEAEMNRLQARREGLVKRFDGVNAELDRLTRAAKATETALKTAKHRCKAELLKSVVKKIVLYFRYTDKHGLPTRKKSFLDRVEIYPIEGEKLCFANGNETGPG